MTLRLLRLVAPAAGGVALGALLSFATLAAGIGLMATAAYAIARAAVVTSFVEIEAALAGVRAFALARGALRYAERYVAHDVSFQLLARLRAWFYAAVEPLAPAVLWRRRGGDLLSRIVADVETLEQLSVRVLLPAAAAAGVAIAASGLLALLHPAQGAVLAAAMIAIGAGLPLAARRLARASALAQVAARAELSALAVDCVQGMADLVAMGQERALLDRVDEVGRRLERAERRLALVRGLASGAAAVLGSGTVVAVLVVGVAAGGLGGVWLVVVPLATLAALEAVVPLPVAIEHLERSLGAAARLFELADETPAVREPVGPTPPLPPVAAIELAGVRFAYEPGLPPVLDGVDLRVAPGERVLVVGPSGAGKTTLAHLLLRFREPAAGTIRIGGRDVRAWRSDDVRELFGVVAQDTHLFAGTLRTNLLLARPDATEAQLAGACARARLEGVVARLPQGLDTWIGENGLLLSGGERQRVAIARALLKDAPILLLDEPAAHLDAETEREVMAALEPAMAGRTVIAIGHRPVASPGSRVLVLEDGRLRAAGEPL